MLTLSFGDRNSTNWLFLKSQNPQPTLPVCHSHPLPTIPIWDFNFEWYILSARVWTPALMLHLTNPCSKRNVLSLTKLKGKIYKMKSLRNYITVHAHLDHTCTSNIMSLTSSIRLTTGNSPCYTYIHTYIHIQNFLDIHIDLCRIV